MRRKTFQIWDRVMEVSPLISLILFHQLRHPRGVESDCLPGSLVLNIRVETVARNLARHGRQAVVPENEIREGRLEGGKPVAGDALRFANRKVGMRGLLQSCWVAPTFQASLVIASFLHQEIFGAHQKLTWRPAPCRVSSCTLPRFAQTGISSNSPPSR